MIPCVIAINSSSTIYIDSAPTLSAATTLTETVVIELGNRHYAQVWGDNFFFCIMEISSTGIFDWVYWCTVLSGLNRLSRLRYLYSNP